MTFSSRRTISLTYRTNAGRTQLKNAVYRGIRIRESDSALVMMLAKPDMEKTFTIDVGTIDTVVIDGKTRKLKSPGSQHKYREAELKYLLEGRELESWTGPYLKEYALEGVVVRKGTLSGFAKAIISVVSLLLMALPILACVAVFAIISFVVWIMFNSIP